MPARGRLEIPIGLVLQLALGIGEIGGGTEGRGLIGVEERPGLVGFAESLTGAFPALNASGPSKVASRGFLSRKSPT